MVKRDRSGLVRRRGDDDAIDMPVGQDALDLLEIPQNIHPVDPPAQLKWIIIQKSNRAVPQHRVHQDPAQHHLPGIPCTADQDHALLRMRDLPAVHSIQDPEGKPGRHQAEEQEDSKQEKHHRRNGLPRKSKTQDHGRHKRAADRRPGIPQQLIDADVPPQAPVDSKQEKRGERTRQRHRQREKDLLQGLVGQVKPARVQNAR